MRLKSDLRIEVKKTTLPTKGQQCLTNTTFDATPRKKTKGGRLSPQPVVQLKDQTVTKDVYTSPSTAGT